MPIAAADRQDFVRKVAGLSLWLTATDLARRSSFYDAVTGMSPLYRLTTFWDRSTPPPTRDSDRRDDRWKSLVSQLDGVYTRHLDAKEMGRFEQESLDILWPFLEARIEQDVADWPWLPSCLGSEEPEAGIFGFFLYEFGRTETDEPTIVLHMGNSFSPHSPFADPHSRARELSQLLDDAEVRVPSVQHIVSTSWLNCFEPFQAFFPSEWVHSTVAQPLGYTYDWWGQFVTRRGGFHRPNGDHLRSTGRFLYPSVTCGCAIPLLRRHIADHFDLR